MALEAPALPEKDFFSMGEACRIAQVPAHTLRYWERRVGLLRPARRSSGHRRYTRSDLETISELKDLLGRRRMTAAGARRAMLERRRGTGEAASPAAGSSELPEATLRLLRDVRKEIRALVDELSK